jgi:hypothetical protein
MDIDLSRTVNEIFRTWSSLYFFPNSPAYAPAHSRKKNRFFLLGEHGSGKTTAVQEYIRTHQKMTRYFSFACLDNYHALQAFAKAFSLENKTPASWDDACRQFQDTYRNETLLVFFDDLEFFPQKDEFRKACYEHIAKNRIVVSEIQRCLKKEWSYDIPEFVTMFIGWRTLSDYCKYFPDYSKQDVVRLFSVTGGIPAVIKELDAEKPLEENLRALLRYDSAFTTYLPEWMCEHFRTPESYYPILCSMAKGKRRLSDIAHDVGFPNNKCLNYLQALMRAQLVRPVAVFRNKTSEYELTNSYIAAWCLFAYEQRSMMLTDPDALLQKLMRNLDRRLALPAFRSACYSYMELSTKEYFDYFRSRSDYEQEILRDVHKKLKDGHRVALDFCILQDGHSLVAVIPDDLDRRFTKYDLQRIRNVVGHMEKFFDTEIVIFNVNRFSDWCVHEASRDVFLHLVTAERLKY